MDDDGKIHRVDTVPPPAGESDAYNAPTKVGPVSSNAWADLIKEATEKHALTRGAASRARGEPVPASQREPVAEAPVEHEAEIPRLDEDDYALAEPTKVDARAEPPPLPAPLPSPAATARASVTTRPPPSAVPAQVSRPPVFPGWEAGTNLVEQAVRESARKRTRWLAVGVGVGVTVAVACAVLALFR